LGFKITQAIIPEIKLPDYKKVAGKINTDIEKKKVPLIVTDEELEEVIKGILDSRKETPKEGEKAEDVPAPELTDEFAKTLGEYENVTDFKTKLRDNLKEEKEHKEKDKKRLAIVDGILEKADIPLPQVLVDRQSERNIEHFKASVERMGMKFEDYIKNSGKTIDDIKKEALPDAEKKVKINLMLEEIAKVEAVEVDKAEMESEVKKVMDHYAAQPNLGAEHKPDEHNIRHYVEGVMKNDAIFKMLEEQK